MEKENIKVYREKMRQVIGAKEITVNRCKTCRRIMFKPKCWNCIDNQREYELEEVIFVEKEILKGEEPFETLQQGRERYYENHKKDLKDDKEN